MDVKSGPIDILLLELDGAQFSGRIGPALPDRAVRDIVRNVDVLFVEDTVGLLGSVDLGRLGVDPIDEFVDLDGHLGGDDVRDGAA